jgi:hypothetical protein
MMTFWGVPFPSLAMFIEAGRQLDPLDIRGTLEVFSWGDPGDDFLLGGQAFVAPGGEGVAWFQSDGADYDLPMAVVGAHGPWLVLTDADGNDTLAPVVDGVVTIPVTVYPVYVNLLTGVSLTTVTLGFGTSLTSNASATMQGGPAAPSVLMSPNQVIRGPYKDKVHLSAPNVADGASVFQSKETPTTGAPLAYTILLNDPVTVWGFLVRSGRPWQDIGTILDADVDLLIDGDWTTVYTIEQDMPMILTGGSSQTDGHSSYFDLLKAWRFSWPVRLGIPVSNVTGMRVLTREVSCGQAVDPEARNGYGELDEDGAPVVLDSVRSTPPTLALTRVRFFGAFGGGDPGGGPGGGPGGSAVGTGRYLITYTGIANGGLGVAALGTSPLGS